jgi:hypothetical protein
VRADYIWWDFAMVLLHSHKSHKPLGAQAQASGNASMRSLAFLDVDHPAVKIIWTKLSILKEMKKNSQYNARLNIALTPPPYKYPDTGMTRYWNEGGDTK